MLEFLKVLRPFNCFMAAVGVAVGIVISTPLSSISLKNATIALLSVIAITGAGNVFNDVVDVESDRINRPHRPIASGKIKRSAALIYATFLFSFGVLLSTWLNIFCFTLAIVNSIILMVYSLVFQDKILVGNVVVGYLVGSTFLYGALSQGMNLFTVAVIMLMATFSNTSREIVKDMEDIEGDKVYFLKKLARKVKTGFLSRFRERGGRITSISESMYMKFLAMFFIVVSVVLSPLPYINGTFGNRYLFIVFFADAIFLYAAFILFKSERSKKSYGRVQKLMKLGMFVALIAFLVGRFF